MTALFVLLYTRDLSSENEIRCNYYTQTAGKTPVIGLWHPSCNWYNRTGWLAIKLQVTYLLLKPLPWLVIPQVSKTGQLIEFAGHAQMAVCFQPKHRQLYQAEFLRFKKKMPMILVAAPRSFKIGLNFFCQPGWTCPVFTCLLQCCVASTVLALKLFLSVTGMRPTDLPFR